MRFSPILLWRKPSREPIPLQPILPLKLNNSVSGKGEKVTDVCCLQEMTVMLSCFKKNEFNQSLCNKEIEGFQKCYKTTMDSKKTRKERDRAGILTPGDKKLSYKQLNMMLKKFPNFES